MDEETYASAFASEKLRDAVGNSASVDEVLKGPSLPVTSTETLSGEAAEQVLANTAAMKTRPREKDSEVTDIATGEGGEPNEGEELSYEDKVKRLEFAIRRQPAHREIFLRILETCRTPTILGDLEQNIASWPEFKSATADQYLMICILERYEGLVRYEMTEDDVVVTPDMKQGLDEDAIDDLVAYWMFETTPLGRDVAQRNAPAKRIRELLNAIPLRKQTYLDVLDFCNGHTRTYKEIESLLEGRDVLWAGRESLQQPLQPSIFVDKLERAGAIVWDDGWRITESGKAIAGEVAKAS